MDVPSGLLITKGKNLAIAEWPTATGPTDYALSIALTPSAVLDSQT
jgi:type I restriction enzyme R subunit